MMSQDKKKLDQFLEEERSAETARQDLATINDKIERGHQKAMSNVKEYASMMS